MAEQEIQIQLDEQMMKGVYANLAVISHNENEFITDFIFIHPPQGKVVSRVIFSPSHAKRLLNALTDNVKQYEKMFGKIPEPKQPPPPTPGIGIQLSKN
ncbi:MAG: DUF3467 domain-containing protein [Candidatus Margulisiibacteriota bacterium]